MRSKIILALVKFNSVKQVCSALINNTCGRESCTGDREVLNLALTDTSH